MFIDTFCNVKADGGGICFGVVKDDWKYRCQRNEIHGIYADDGVLKHGDWK